MKRDEMAMRVFQLSQEIQFLKDEKEELREELAKRMKPDEIIRLETPVGPYRMVMGSKQETTLCDNNVLVEILGMEIFMDAAKVGCEALKAALKVAVCNSDQEKELLNDCIYSVADVPALKLLKGGG